MLGDFGLFAKRTDYEGSGCVPMVLMGRAGDQRVGHHRVDDRLVGLQDLMPTLLDLAGIPVPQSCDGLSMSASAGARPCMATAWKTSARPACCTTAATS